MHKRNIKFGRNFPNFRESFLQRQREKEKAFTPEEAKIISEKTNRYVVRFNQGNRFS